jgi:hypothetical protein
MWRNLCVGVLKVAAGIAVATAVVELLFVLIEATPLRWTLPLPPVALYGPDPDTGYRHRANASGLWLTEHRSLVTTSNLGLRDRNRDLDHNGVPRAVVIGDSFVEALQVDQSETAVAVAESVLSREHSGAEVVNLGLAGARPAVEVARLQSEGRRLTPDLAVVMLSVETLLSPSVMDDSEFTGYRRDPSGEFRLSYRFRDSQGYRFRTSLAGRVYYWLLDHSQVARIINARKNSGLLAEWFDQVAAAGTAQTTGAASSMAWSCASALLDNQLALWRDGKPEESNALLHAFIRDLAAIRLSERFPIIVATWGIEARCPSLEAKRVALVTVMRAKIEAAGLQFVDLDARVLAKTGPSGMSRLRGFGAGIGRGHLNVEGNRVYGEVFADIIRTALPAQ